jgi:hypothetical protein
MKVILLLDFGLKLRKTEKDVDNLTRKWRKNCAPNPCYVFLWEMFFFSPNMEEPEHDTTCSYY